MMILVQYDTSTNNVIMGVNGLLLFCQSNNLPAISLVGTSGSVYYQSLASYVLIRLPLQHLICSRYFFKLKKKRVSLSAVLVFTHWRVVEVRMVLHHRIWYYLPIIVVVVSHFFFSWPPTPPSLLRLMMILE
jgi:hypothetical protein